MGRPELVLDLRIVLGALVGVLDQQANRGTGGASLEHARKDLHLIRLATLGGMARRAWTATIQVGLQIGLAELDARRAAIDDGAERKPVTLAEGGDGKQLAEGIAGHGRSSIVVQRTPHGRRVLRR